MNGAPQLRFGSPPVMVQVQPSRYWDTESSTAQTIKAMCAGIHRSVSDEQIRTAARLVPSVWGRVGSPAVAFQHIDRASREMAGVAIADWWFAKHFIHFVQDAALVLRLAGLQDALEALTDPTVMIREVHPQGDCDCFTMFLCALMQAQHIPWEIVTLACSPRQPGVWSHVFPRAVIGGLYLPMDASHGKYPGWSVPSRDIQRLQVWDASGNPISGPVSVDEEVM